MVGFYLNVLWQLRMLARVPIIIAYNPSAESMLDHASPSYKIAIMITGLVTNCLGINHSLVLQKLSTKQLTFIILQIIHSSILAKYSQFYSCKLILVRLKITSSFILVLGKADIKCAQSCIGGRQNLRECLFYLQLLVGFDTLTYRKRLQLIPYTCGYQDLFLAPLPGSNSVG